MDPYEKNKEAILEITQRLAALVDQAASGVSGNQAAFEQWSRACASVDRQLRGHVVRIAAVGAIKSGKSTLVNALLEDDYLKRGAGVVTSIVTRIRQGKDLTARLFFKSWDEINADIQQALVLFPSDDWRSEQHDFDIRRNRDRNDLSQALDALDHDRHIVKDGLNANGVLLSSYLRGYAQVESFISAESATREFDSGHFPEHRDFVGNDALAVYLKDIELEVPSGMLKRDIELADCQGSDSPNPLHLMMIQDYLLKTHLIVYVISSRTGLRQADIRFLSIIKKMGIADNMLFVCNCDINEHEGLEDLRALIERIREELSLIVAQPEFFTFSALYNLFDRSPSTLSPKDRDRLQQWKKAGELIDFLESEIQRFRTYLERKLTRERSALLLNNQLAHLEGSAAGMKQWVQLNRDLLRRDAGEARAMAAKLQVHRLHMLQVQSMIQSTLQGAIRKVSQELKKEVDRLLDPGSGPIIGSVTGFVREYQVDVTSYRERLAASGFSNTLYLAFQELKQAVDGYMAEKINPEIIGHLHQLEQRLQEHLHLVAEPYEAMVADALERYQEALMQLGVGDGPVNRPFEAAVDLESVKQTSGIALPPAAANMRYSAYIKTEAILRLGFYAIVRSVGKLLKKSDGAKEREEERALRDGIRRMKSETERSVSAHFKDYKENIKFQYVQRLADMAGSRLSDRLSEQFGAYVGDIKEMVDTMAGQQDDKARADQRLAVIETDMEAILSRLAVLRQEIWTLIDNDATLSTRRNET